MLKPIVPILLWTTRLSLTYTGPLSFLRLIIMLISTLTTSSSSSQRRRRRSITQIIVSTWCNLEGLFFLFSFADRYINGSSYRKQRPSHCPNFPSKRREELFQRIMNQNARTPEEGQAWLIGWFGGVGNCKYEDLRLENLREWLAWAWFDQQDCSQLTKLELLEVETTLIKIQELTGTMPPGRNSKIQVQRQSIDPWYPRTAAHPLLFYTIVGIIEHVAAPIVMRNILGFTRHVEGKIGYWYYPERNKVTGAFIDRNDVVNTTLPPILFFHGIGVGLAPYYQVMKTLMSTNRPLYIMEIPEATLSIGTSLPFFHAAPIAVLEVLNTWDQILPPNQYKFSIVGHSYGTFVAAWFLEHRRDRILNCCMCDPVSIMLHHADVCDRFLYGGMSSRAFNKGKSQKDLLMNWIVRQEPGIVLTLMRNLWWYKNTAWLEDLGVAKSGVLLGLGDEYAAVDKIVEGIQEYNAQENITEKEQISLKTYKGIPHGLFLVYRRMQLDMLDVLSRE
jgi:pimeloyl-ACP methyl ester carboxylesterase